jgi:hypothetical protein
MKLFRIVRAEIDAVDQLLDHNRLFLKRHILKRGGGAVDYTPTIYRIQLGDNYYTTFSWNFTLLQN